VLILTLFGTLALTTLALFAFAPTASYLNLIDTPDNGRKLHTGHVPLTGGMSVYLSLFTVLYISGIADASLTGSADFWPVVTACLALLVMAHAVDDVVELRAATRFGIDAVLALVICAMALVKLTTLGNLFGLGEVTLGRFAMLMTLFCFIAASNAFNMVDGIDSLCSGLGLIAFGTLITLILISGSPESSLLVNPLLVVMVALVPMYFANLGMFGARSRVFLGDSGARLIGFIAAIALICAAQKGMIRPVMAYFPIAVPVCDCLVLMGLRVLKGRSPLSADRLHLHHLLQDIGLGTHATRRFILALGLVVSLFGVFFQVTHTSDWIISAFVVVSFWTFIFFRFWLMRVGVRRSLVIARAPSLPTIEDSSDTHQLSTETSTRV